MGDKGGCFSITQAVAMTESRSLQYVNSMNCKVNWGRGGQGRGGDGEHGGLSIGHLPSMLSILGRS